MNGFAGEPGQEMLVLELNWQSRLSGSLRGEGPPKKMPRNRMGSSMTKGQSRLSADVGDGMHTATRLCLTKAVDGLA